MAWSQVLTRLECCGCPTSCPAQGHGPGLSVGEGHLGCAANTAPAGVDTLLGRGGSLLVRSPILGRSRGHPGPDSLGPIHGTPGPFSGAFQHEGALVRSVAIKPELFSLQLAPQLGGVAGGIKGRSLGGQGDPAGIGNLALLQVLHQLCQPAFGGGVIF